MLAPRSVSRRNWASLHGKAASAGLRILRATISTHGSVRFAFQTSPCAPCPRSRSSLKRPSRIPGLRADSATAWYSRGGSGAADCGRPSRSGRASEGGLTPIRVATDPTT